MNRFVIYIYTLSKQGFFSLLHQGNIVHKLQATCEQHANLLVNCDLTAAGSSHRPLICWS